MAKCADCAHFRLSEGGPGELKPPWGTCGRAKSWQFFSPICERDCANWQAKAREGEK
jgi:hypothetical protein